MTRVIVFAVLALVVCIGCGGPDATVQGTVTIDGQLARRGTVQFHPVDGGPTAYGTIDGNGGYSLRVGKGDLSDPNAGKIASGEYVVTAVVNMASTKDASLGEAGPPQPGARLNAGKYVNKDTSDLRAVVKSGHNVVPLELAGVTPEEAAAAAEEAAAAENLNNDVGATPPAESEVDATKEAAAPTNITEPSSNAQESTQ